MLSYNDFSNAFESTENHDDYYAASHVMIEGLTCECRFYPEMCQVSVHYIFVPGIDPKYWPYIDDNNSDARGVKVHGWTTMPYKGKGVWQDSFFDIIDCNNLDSLIAYIRGAFEMNSVIKNVNVINQRLDEVFSTIGKF